MFVTVVLGAGVLFIVLSDPPRTVCDSQLELFDEKVRDFLLLDSRKPNRKTTRYTKLHETCRATSSAGGCYELFLNLKQMIKDAKTVSVECHGKLRGHTQYSTAVWQSLDLMAQLAWGAKPPLTPALKTGWLDPADLNLYCELKNSAIYVFSEEKWNSFVAGYFKSLPGAANLPRNEAWQKMLFSVNCTQYL